MRAWVDDTRDGTGGDAAQVPERFGPFVLPVWLRGPVVFLRLRLYLAVSYAEFLVLVALCVAPITDIEDLPPLLPLLATMVLMVKLLLVLRAIREYSDACVTSPTPKYIEHMSDIRGDFVRVMWAIPTAAMVLANIWGTGLIIVARLPYLVQAGFTWPSDVTFEFSVPLCFLLVANVIFTFDGFISAARNHHRGYSEIFPEIVRVVPKSFQEFPPLEQPTCSICLDDFEPQDSSVQLPCSHLFHTDCIERWFQRDVSCPMRCRRAFVRLVSNRPAPDAVLPRRDEALPTTFSGTTGTSGGSTLPGGVGDVILNVQDVTGEELAPELEAGLTRERRGWEERVTSVLVVAP